MYSHAASEYAKFAGLTGHVQRILKNVRRKAIVKSNQMSGEKLKMSGEAQNNFAYSGHMRQVIPYLSYALFGNERKITRTEY